MSETKIRLREFDDIKEFVNAAERCDYDVDVCSDRLVVDAKSLMGILSMDLSNVLTVKYSEKDMHFANVLNKYAISV